MHRWLFLVLVLAGCTPRPPKPVWAFDVTSPRRIVFHVDQAFRIVNDRTMWLEEAAWRLEQGTRGKLHVDFQYDLDFSGRVQRYPKNEWYLVDLPEDSGIAESFDLRHRSKVLGECDYDFSVIYLITERVTTHNRFVHVVMHEILHAMGLEHLKDESDAVMFPYVKSVLPLVLTDADLDEFCRVTRCSVKEVRP